MKIAIDYDGTWMEHTMVYCKLMKALQVDGHQVGIMTGRLKDTYHEDLERITQRGLTPDFFYNTGDFDCAERELSYWIETGQVTAERDLVVCIFKARMCNDNGIDILFDDAADMIRVFLPQGCQTVVLKSPTQYNMTLPKWGDQAILNYEVANESD